MASTVEATANERLRQAFLKHHSLVVAFNLSAVVDQLFQDQVLSAADYSDLQHITVATTQARQLLAILHNQQHPLAFIKLRQALSCEVAYHWFIDKLDQFVLDNNNTTSCHLDVTASPVTPNDVTGGNQHSDSKYRVPGVVIGALLDGRSIHGVTSLFGLLYILRLRHHEQLEVYNYTSVTSPQYVLLQKVSVPGLGGMECMTSCTHYQCLYIADCSGCIHRFNVVDHTFSKWTTRGSLVCGLMTGRPLVCGLSVTSTTHNVLVTCRKINKLIEFTTHGHRVRQINLQIGVSHPTHAVQLAGRDEFIVCHGFSQDAVHRVCVVDASGHVVRSYSGSRGPATVGQLGAPCHVTVDDEGFVFVSDVSNRRVVLLSPTLNYVGDVISGDHLLFYKYTTHLDPVNKCLFVSSNEWLTTGQLTVLSLK